MREKPSTGYKHKTFTIFIILSIIWKLRWQILLQLKVKILKYRFVKELRTLFRLVENDYEILHPKCLWNRVLLQIRNAAKKFLIFR